MQALPYVVVTQEDVAKVYEVGLSPEVHVDSLMADASCTGPLLKSEFLPHI